MSITLDTDVKPAPCMVVFPWFDINIGIWWHYDDYEITQIGDFQKVYILERVTNKKIQRKTLCQAQNITSNGLY